jgi:hypothetical protein
MAKFLLVVTLPTQLIAPETSMRLRTNSVSWLCPVSVSTSRLYIQNLFLRELTLHREILLIWSRIHSLGRFLSAASNQQHLSRSISQHRNVLINSIAFFKAPVLNFLKNLQCRFSTHSLLSHPPQLLAIVINTGNNPGRYYNLITLQKKFTISHENENRNCPMKKTPAVLAFKSRRWSPQLWWRPCPCQVSNQV